MSVVSATVVDVILSTVPLFDAKNLVLAEGRELIVKLDRRAGSLSIIVSISIYTICQAFLPKHNSDNFSYFAKTKKS